VVLVIPIVLKYLSWSVLTKYYSGDQIKKNKMGGACDTYGGEEKYM
jgi:hypothetical protein